MTSPAEGGTAAPRWFARAHRRPAPATAAVDPAPFAGRWLNSDRAGGGLERLEIAVEGEGLAVEAWEAEAAGPRRIGRAAAPVYAASPAGGDAIGFVARFALDAADLLLAAYGKSGILVVDAYHRFASADGRAPFTRREFFRRG